MEEKTTIINVKHEVYEEPHHSAYYGFLTLDLGRHVEIIRVSNIERHICNSMNPLGESTRITIKYKEIEEGWTTFVCNKSNSELREIESTREGFGFVCDLFSNGITKKLGYPVRKVGYEEIGTIGNDHVYKVKYRKIPFSESSHDKVVEMRKSRKDKKSRRKNRLRNF